MILGTAAADLEAGLDQAIIKHIKMEWSRGALGLSASIHNTA